MADICNHYGYSLLWLITGQGPKHPVDISDAMANAVTAPMPAVELDDILQSIRGLVSNADDYIDEVRTYGDEHGDDREVDWNPALLEQLEEDLNAIRDLYQAGPAGAIYAGATQEARDLAATILRMSAAGGVDEKRLAAIAELLSAGDEDAQIRKLAEETLARREALLPDKLKFSESERQAWIDKMVIDFKQSRANIVQEPIRKAV